MNFDERTYIDFFNAHSKGRHFVKMHGLENHFVIFNGRESPFLPNKSEISRICNVKTGIGADQLIILNQPSNDGLKSGAKVFMKLLNIDGREVEACGNATRCVAWLLMEYENEATVKIETLAGILECHKLEDYRVQCNMGIATLDSKNIPLSIDIDTLNVELESGPLSNPVISNIGNPHATFFVDNIENVDIEKWAPAVQKNSLFPEEVNVGVAEIIDQHTLKLEVYERGAGLTTACGSGACAAVYAANKRKLDVSNKMQVIMPAGYVDIELLNDDSLTMSGPITYVYSGLLPKT
jgi:diaminopimelate epimerase